MSKIPRRTVHQVLTFEHLIWDAKVPTILLFGSIEAQRWVMHRANLRAWGGDAPIFWCPYPGISLTNPMMFDHVIVDSSFDQGNLDHTKWWSRDVFPHVTPGSMVTLVT